MEFVVVDVETANAQMSSICQIGIVGFKDGENTFMDGLLVNPGDYFDPMNESIHGITSEDVADAPNFAEAYGWIAERLNDRIVVSHSRFDRTALDRAADRYALANFSGRWLDSQVVARRAWPYLESGYSLNRLSDRFGIKFQHHDAVQDAYAAGLVMLRAIAETGIDIEGWFERCLLPISGLKTVARTHTADGPLTGEVVVITGSLSLPRHAIADLIAKAGGDVEESVTKHTTILVVGDQDISRLAGKERSAKHIRAEQLIAKGKRIRILQESDLEALLRIAKALS